MPVSPLRDLGRMCMETETSDFNDFCNVNSQSPIVHCRGRVCPEQGLQISERNEQTQTFSVHKDDAAGSSIGFAPKRCSQAKMDLSHQPTIGIRWVDHRSFLAGPFEH